MNIDINVPSNSLVTIFSKNFLKGGIILGIALTLIDIIKYKKNLISFYAFMSASFFIVNLLQFYYIDKVNKNLNRTFLLHTIVGGIVWVLYSVILYILYINNITTDVNILITLLFIIIISIIYYILLKNNYINNILK